jgi:NADH-quinone oxidoreductase subunit G
MPKIHIDGREYEVKAGQNLLQAVLSLGLDLPYFCWHPALGSVGACRLCAVKQFKDQNDTEGKIVMACMTPAEDGTRISLTHPEAREFRRSVTEWLMVNHPHDCPICDEGGECHLQDMTVMTGHNYRRYRFEKRTHRNQNLGPFVNHEMNRCIQCYRCVRFYKDYADGRDLDVFGAHDSVYFGRPEDGVLENEFAGNLVEICPTGVFTDKTLKEHYTRKWDLQTAPSVCVHCGLGCNIIPGERYGKLRRIRNRYNGAVNGYFLCDRGRYGGEFVNSGRRIRQPMLHGKPVAEETALAHIRSLLSDGGNLIGVGSPRASLEANFALRRLVGADRFHLGLSAYEPRLVRTALDILQNGSVRAASLADAALCDAVLVLGEDVTSTAPMLALALRQAARRQPAKTAAKLKIPDWNDAAVREVIQNRHGPVHIAAPYPTRLDDIATKTYRLAPDDIARLGFDLARNGGEVMEALAHAERPLIVTGLGCGSEAVLQAAANVAWALRDRSQLCIVMPECNTLGLALMGGHEPDGAEVDVAIVLENDLTRRGLPAKRVIAIDHLLNPTSQNAEVALPAATFAESSGTLVNNEGRAQRYYQVFVPPEPIQASWRWLALLSGAPWKTLDDIARALTEELPVFEPVVGIAPPAGFRIDGQRVPREPHRYSGRTAMHANISVHEPQPPVDPDSPLAYSMEGFGGIPPAPLVTHFWSPGWNSIQALNKFQEEIAGPLRGGDPGKRLIEPRSARRPFENALQPFARRERLWLFVPIHHIFGSEELSALAPAIAELAPKPYVALHPEEAPGEEVTVNIDQVTLRLPVRHMDVPRGVAGLYHPGGFGLPAWGRITV